MADKITINNRQVSRTMDAIKKEVQALANFATPAQQRSANNKASKPTIKAGRDRIPKSKRRYMVNGKIRKFPKQMSGGGKAYRAFYLPGNLKRGWNRLSRKKLSKRTKSAFVGPQLQDGGTKKGSIYGRTIRTSHPLFASRAYGKGANGNTRFGQQVTNPAYRASAGQVLRILEQEHSRLWNRKLKKQGFKG